MISFIPNPVPIYGSVATRIMVSTFRSVEAALFAIPVATNGNKAETAFGGIL